MHKFDITFVPVRTVDAKSFSKIATDNFQKNWNSCCPLCKAT